VSDTQTDKHKLTLIVVASLSGLWFLILIHDPVGEGSSYPVGTSRLKLNTISTSIGHCRPHLQVPHEVRCFTTSFLFHNTRLSGLYYIISTISYGNISIDMVNKDTAKYLRYTQYHIKTAVNSNSLLSYCHETREHM